MAMIYYSKRIQRKISKGKVHGTHLEKPGTSFQDPLLVRSHSTRLILPLPPQWVVTTHVTCCLPGRFIRDSVPQVFIGRVIMEAPSARHGLKFHSPRRQAGTNHIICWDIPGAVSHSYQISKFLDASQRPGKTIHLPHIFVIPSDSETGLFKFF